MITKVAWRNIWRNKLRSSVVIIAVALGLLAGVFSTAFMMGMMDQKVKSVIEQEMSHFQIHSPDFRDEFRSEDTIPRNRSIEQTLREDPDVIGVSSRVISMLMMSSANNSGALKITGIDPGREASVTNIHKTLVEGTYFDTKKKNTILISSKTAEKYKLNLRSKVVLTLQDIHGEITAGAFRVIGIYNSKNPMFDESNAFVNKYDLQRLMNLNGGVHEIAVLLNSHDLADPKTELYQKRRADLEVLSWADLSPGMRFFIEAKDTYTFFIVGIILVALLFSILNTMLMAVLERVKEIGMLMAVGMTKMRVFRMIMTETFFLVLIGGPLGLFISWVLIKYFGEHGIDLGNAAYEDFGFSNVVYPFLELRSYIQVAIMVAVMAIIAAIYPALKALSLKPIEAIHKHE